MRAHGLVCALSLGAGVAAFGVAGAVSLGAGVQPLHAVLRGIAAFAVVVCVARWSAGALGALGLLRGDQSGGEEDGRQG